MLNFKDQFLLQIFAGVIGAMVADIYSLIAKLVGLAKYFVWNISADLFFSSHKIYTFWGYILGMLGDWMIGSMIGLVIGYVLEKRGYENVIIKSICVALIAWISLFGVFLHVAHTFILTSPFPLKEPVSFLSSFIQHLVFGTVTGFVYLKFLKQLAK